MIYTYEQRKDYVEMLVENFWAWHAGYGPLFSWGICENMGHWVDINIVKVEDKLRQDIHKSGVSRNAYLPDALADWFTEEEAAKMRIWWLNNWIEKEAPSSKKDWNKYLEFNKIEDIKPIFNTEKGKHYE